MTQKNLYKVVILGDSAVGKTSLLHSYIDQKFLNSYKATIGADMFQKEVLVDGKVINLIICDTAGQERFRSMGEAFYRGVDCCVLVYDITCRKSFENIESWITEFMQKGCPKEPQKFPFVLIGNKVDKQDQRQIKQEQVKQLLRKHPKLSHFETSAKKKQGVEQAFLKIGRLALQYKKQQIFIPTYIQSTKISSIKKNQQKQYGLCKTC